MHMLAHTCIHIRVYVCMSYRITSYLRTMIQHCEQVFDSQTFTSTSRSDTQNVTTAGIYRLAKSGIRTEGYRGVFLLVEQIKFIIA